MSDPAPHASPPAPPRRRRHIAISIVMVIVGISLLLPGLCAIVFAVSFGGAASDPSLTLLWLFCLLIAAGGVWLIVKALR